MFMYNSYLHTELMAFTLGPTNCLILGPKENQCVINVSSQEQFPALEAADVSSVAPGNTRRQNP